MTRAAEEMNNKSSNTTTNVGGHSIVENNADFEESGKNIVLNAAAFAQAYAYSAYDDIEKRLEILTVVFVFLLFAGFGLIKLL